MIWTAWTVSTVGKLLIFLFRSVYQFKIGIRDRNNYVLQWFVTVTDLQLKKKVVVCDTIMKSLYFTNICKMKNARVGCWFWKSSPRSGFGLLDMEIAFVTQVSSLTLYVLHIDSDFLGRLSLYIYKYIYIYLLVHNFFFLYFKCM